MIQQLIRLGQIGHYLGPGWLLYRAHYALQLRLGLLQRQLPAGTWERQPLSTFLADPALTEPARYLEYRRRQAPAFLFNPADRRDYQPLFAAWDDPSQETPQQLAAELAQGHLRYFEHLRVQAGEPPDWQRNPFTGQQISARQHWSRIDDFAAGDIKIIWEPSRFAFSYTLVRAYWRSGDEAYAELFWRWVEDWQAHNPPQQGPNWKCGQEISFRLMAWCFGLYGFLEAAATTPARLAALARMIAVSGQRIEANLRYALSQRNNHGISEALGLWTIGLLFPEFRRAAAWRERGRRALEEQALALIYPDGAFAQHSLNYQRLMLHDYLWALRLGDLHGQPFSAELKERVGQAGTLLYQLQDEMSGRLPNYGQNDGALVLPLNNCDYQDFRPAIQAVFYYRHGCRCYPPGPWDEDLLWLYGPAAITAPLVIPQRSDLEAEPGGYYTQRSKNGFVFIRCASFRHRPGQADMLHLDLWWRGQNIALDAGTYSYNAPAPWNNTLTRTAYHNTVSVDGLDQMDRAGRFLWLPWANSQVRCKQKSSQGYLAYWEGEHEGYQRLKQPVYHRRAVLRLGEEDYWLILDALHSLGEHSYRLHWLLSDMIYEWNEYMGCLILHSDLSPYYIQMGVQTGRGVCSLTRADDRTPRGWHSPYYYDRKPALSVECTTRAKTSLFWTFFSPELGRVTTDETSLKIETTQWRGTVNLSEIQSNKQMLVSSVCLSGGLIDRLEV